MVNWLWVEQAAVLSLHAYQLSIHGGGDGLRDEGLLLSALARPLNLAAYGEPDAADLAACYAVGIAKNHPFVDGNKRVPLVTAELFLQSNGYALAATDEKLIPVFLSIAAGEMSGDELAVWLRERLAQTA